MILNRKIKFELQNDIRTTSTFKYEYEHTLHLVFVYRPFCKFTALFTNCYIVGNCWSIITNKLIWSHRKFFLFIQQNFQVISTYTCTHTHTHTLTLSISHQTNAFYLARLKKRLRALILNLFFFFHYYFALMFDRRTNGNEKEDQTIRQTKQSCGMKKWRRNERIERQWGNSVDIQWFLTEKTSGSWNMSAIFVKDTSHTEPGNYLFFCSTLNSPGKKNNIRTRLFWPGREKTTLWLNEFIMRARCERKRQKVYLDVSEDIADHAIPVLL